MLASSPPRWPVGSGSAWRAGLLLTGVLPYAAARRIGFRLARGSVAAVQIWVRIWDYGDDGADFDGHDRVPGLRAVRSKLPARACGSSPSGSPLALFICLRLVAFAPSCWPAGSLCDRLLVAAPLSRAVVISLAHRAAAQRARPMEGLTGAACAVRILTYGLRGPSPRHQRARELRSAGAFAPRPGLVRTSALALADGCWKWFRGSGRHKRPSNFGLAVLNCSPVLAWRMTAPILGCHSCTRLGHFEPCQVQCRKCTTC